MTDAECNVVFKKLERYLSTHKMSWLVEAVNSELENGREQTVAIQAFDEQIDPKGGRSELIPSKKTVKQECFVEFTPKERLQRLIDAVEVVVVETAFMQQDTVRTLASSQKPVSIQFVSPATGQTAHEFNQKQLADRVSSAQRLKRLLDDVRKEI